MNLQISLKNTTDSPLAVFRKYDDGDIHTYLLEPGSVIKGDVFILNASKKLITLKDSLGSYIMSVKEYDLLKSEPMQPLVFAKS